MHAITEKADEIIASLVEADIVGSPSEADKGTFIDIITKIIEMLIGCGLSPAQAERRVANPRLLDRLRLHRLLDDCPIQDKEALKAALLDAGEYVTTAEIKAMYADVKARPKEEQS